MKATQIEGLCECPRCESKNVFLMQTNTHRFQVKCLDCGYKTKYTQKTTAVIDWFNMRLATINNDSSNKKRGRGRPALNKIPES